VVLILSVLAPPYSLVLPYSVLPYAFREVVQVMVAVVDPTLAEGTPPALGGDAYLPSGLLVTVFEASEEDHAESKA